MTRGMPSSALTFKPCFVEPGARLRAIAPAGPFDETAFLAGVARLRARYRVDYDPGIFERSGFLAGSDERRLAELEAAVEDDAVDAIVAARGGYGVTRLLPQLDPGILQRRPKLLVGFSDITALHALWAHAAVASVHGPMVATLSSVSDASFERFCSVIEGKPPEPLTGLVTVAPGRAFGPLLGGNLTVLTALIGTPHFPPLSGAILFLEDVGERPYRLDRMLTTWHAAGAFRGVVGIALGGFTHADPGPDGVTAHDVLIERLARLGVPILSGVPAGHLDDNRELPFGMPVTLDADRAELRFHPVTGP